MKDFKDWWNEAEIFCGDGGMDAAEVAWDYQDEIISMKQREIELLRERVHDLEQKGERLGKSLFPGKWVST